MNHKDIRMTLRYAKLSPDSGREAVINLNFFLFSFFERKIQRFINI